MDPAHIFPFKCVYAAKQYLTGIYRRGQRAPWPGGGRAEISGIRFRPSRVSAGSSKRTRRCGPIFLTTILTVCSHAEKPHKGPVSTTWTLGACWPSRYGLSTDKFARHCVYFGVAPSERTVVVSDVQLTDGACQLRHIQSRVSGGCG